MKLQNGQCRKCLSFGYCYFPKDCGREPPAKSSPLQEQYNWEGEFAKAQPDGVTCQIPDCAGHVNWGWCSIHTPLHYGQLP